MRRFLTGLVALLIALAILCTATFGASAISGNGLWRDSTECPILDADEESNSDLSFAMAKVKYDYDNNRIRLLFTFEFEEFYDVNSCGVIMNFNGMGNIKMMYDGTSEYNNDIYYVDPEGHPLYDASSRNVLLETTVGIKSGIPDNVIMDLIVIDTNGVRSNTYEVDITEEIEDPEDNPGEETKKTSAEKTTKEKTTKVKKTKAKKTTKRKTTKRKTTKAKKTKTKKAKTKKSEDDDEDDYDEDDSQVVIDSDTDDNIEINNRRKKLMLALGAAAAIVAIAAGCAAGIKNRKKDKDGGHEE